MIDLKDIIIIIVSIGFVFLIVIYDKYFAKRRRRPKTNPPQIIRTEEKPIIIAEKPVINKIKCEDFIESLEKVYNLKENGVYSEEDYSQRKTELINKLLKGGVFEKTEDFLINIIPLKNKGVLNLDDIARIKSSLKERAVT